MNEVANILEDAAGLSFAIDLLSAVSLNNRIFSINRSPLMIIVK
jgi:hypothetical protein